MSGRAEQVTGALAALVRVAPRAVLGRIADCEHHARPGDRERHIAALTEVVERLECRLDRQPDNEWFPREPVELMSRGAGGDPDAVCVANALLMISELESADRDYMRDRWEGRPGKAFFAALPEGLRAPLMAGFDLLMERWTQPER